MLANKRALKNALFIADLYGFPVFALDANKRPTCINGFKDATTDEAALDAMFDNPNAVLVGVPTGAVIGLGVLDVDTKKPAGAKWWQDNCHLIPPTLIQQTRSGGFHVFFNHAEGLGCSADAIAPAIDVRADGGYVVWWEGEEGCPTTNRAPPADWPDWLLQKARAGKRGRTGPAQPKNPAELAPPDAASLIGLLRDMPNPAEATRDDYVAAMMAVQGCVRGLEALDLATPEEIELCVDTACEWAARWEGANPSDFETERAKWDSDWSNRDNDLSGWRQLVQIAHKLGVDVSAYRLAEAQAEFGELPPEPEAAAEVTIIDIKANTLSHQINLAEAALMRADLGLYQRGGKVVRAAPVPEPDRYGVTHEVLRIIEIDEHHFVELATRAAIWRRPNKKSGGWIPSRCPPDVAKAYLARKGIELRLPHLNGVIHAPTLRVDGSLLNRPGYDQATGLFFDPRGQTFPEIDDHLLRAQPHTAAGMALNELKELLSEFPFTDKASQSVALSAILTALTRPVLESAPMHAVTATTYGSGKSYLVDLTAAISIGSPVAPIACGSSDEELEKRLGAELIAGRQFIVIDNVDREVNGPLLNQALTQEKVNPRRLGKSENVEVPATAFLMMNGNNLTISADMARRVLLCSLDAGVERPELRKFETNPIEMVKKNRGRYVMAALTILRAYYLEGRFLRPDPLGSFEQWSRWVRGALLWLGEADPVETMNAVREADPKRQQLLAVMVQWDEVLGNRRVTIKEVITAAITPTTGEFREALLAVAGASGAIDGRRLGAWLGYNKGRIVGDMCFESDTLRRGSATWRLNGARDVRTGGTVHDFPTERTPPRAEEWQDMAAP